MCDKVAELPAVRPISDGTRVSWVGCHVDSRKSSSMPRTITKSDIIRAVQELPEDATLDDAFERLFVLHKIEQGLRDMEEGRMVSQEEMEVYVREKQAAFEGR